jgi:replicative DNA helicase
MNIAQHVAVHDKKSVGFFSLEMSKEELVDRLLVGQADIDAWKLKTGKLSEDDITKLSNAMGELAEAPLYIDDTPALSILEMRTKAGDCKLKWTRF